MTESIETKIEVGQVIEFEYPAANYLLAPVRWEPRRLKVNEVRNIFEKPLDLMTLALNPQLRRGKTLLRGDDLDKGEERSFYVESMRSIRIDGAHLIAGQGEKWCVILIDPSGDSTPEVVFRANDQAEAAAWLEGWEFEAGDLIPAICPADNVESKTISAA